MDMKVATYGPTCCSPREPPLAVAVLGHNNLLRFLATDRRNCPSSAGFRPPSNRCTSFASEGFRQLDVL